VWNSVCQELNSFQSLQELRLISFWIPKDRKAIPTKPLNGDRSFDIESGKGTITHIAIERICDSEQFCWAAILANIDRFQCVTSFSDSPIKLEQQSSNG
jgi:hypothetical protein